MAKKSFQTLREFTETLLVLTLAGAGFAGASVLFRATLSTTLMAGVTGFVLTSLIWADMHIAKVTYVIGRKNYAAALEAYRAKWDKYPDSKWRDEEFRKATETIDRLYDEYRQAFKDALNPFTDYKDNSNAKAWAAVMLPLLVVTAICTLGGLVGGAALLLGSSHFMAIFMAVTAADILGVMAVEGNLPEGQSI